MTIPAMFTAIGFATAVAAASGDTLHTIAELNDFDEDSTRRYTPFCITGTVQSVRSPSDGRLIVSDREDWIEINNFSNLRPNPGDRVAITGRAHMSQHQEVDMAAQEIALLGRDTVAKPIELPLNRLDEDAHHLRTIITEGVVIDAFPDEIDTNNRILILKDEETIMPAAFPAEQITDADLTSLLDAKIRIKGSFIRSVSGGRKFSGPLIDGEARRNITVVDPAPEDPFAAPPLEKSLYRSPREIARRGKRSVAGEILAVWNGNRAMLRTDDDRIVNLTLAHGQNLPAPGETVIVAGYPETDLFRLNLTRTIVRVVSADSPAVDPEDAITDLGSVFNGKDGPTTIDPASHGRLLRIRGTVQSVPSSESASRRLLLAAGRHKLTVDLSNRPDAATGIDVGAVVEATGRCLLEIDSWSPDDIFPRIRSVVLVIRTPDDLNVIARPPWWTPVRLLVVITLLLVALIGVYIWNRVLQQLVNRRGRELYREQVARAIAEFKTGERTRLAVELHDSLSQTLAGVACQVAASAKTLDRNPAVARRCIETADKILNSCRTELRQCLFDLRSNTLEEPNFSAAIRKTLDQLGGNAAITIRFNVPRSRLKDTAAHAILAIIRELTGNALRHGEATEVKIAGAIEDGRILFSVRDNGRGFDPAACDGPVQGHFGLEGIRNRLEKLNGSFTVDSKPGAGTKATVTIPLPQVKRQT